MHRTHAHMLIQYKLTASALPSVACVEREVCPVKRKITVSCLKKKNILSVSSGDKQTVKTAADVLLLDEPSSTLSQLFEHRGAEKLLFGFEKCEFNGIVQTHAIGILHLALTTNTHTHTNIH